MAEKNSEKLSIWYTPTLKRLLEEKALKDKQSTASIVRVALSLYFKKTL